jgi:hypothetical protein
MYKRILLAYDGSDAGQKALLDCQDLANLIQSNLICCVKFQKGLYAGLLSSCDYLDH